MIDMLIAGLAEMIAIGLESLVDLILPVFGFDFTLFNTSFPFAKTAYTIFQSVGLGIVFLLAAVQTVPFFWGNQRNKSTPIRAGLFAILAVGGVYYGNYILTAIMDIAQMPYTALMNADIGYGSLQDIISMSSVIGVIYDACYQQSLILYLLLLLLIGISFVILLLEAVERYVMLFVLIYTTPLAASTLASETTSGIFKKFFTMFISQCILLILNVWSLQMITSLFANMGNSPNPMVTLLVGYAFLRIAKRLDSYLNQLGLNAAVTGAGLGSELFFAGMALMSKASSFKGQKSMDGKGAILGFSRTFGNVFGKLNPVAGMADGARNYAGAVGKSAAGAARAAYDTMAGGSGIGAGMGAFASKFKSDFAQNKHDAFMKTQDSSLWARGIGQARAAASATDRSVNQTMETMFSNGSLSDRELHDLANTPFAANRAFGNVPENAEVNDATAVAATIQGIGLQNAFPEADEAIQVGYGNLNADNAAFSMTSDGIRMSYSMNGKEHTWDVRNDAQMSSLSHAEQSGYTKFRSSGHTYYARHINQYDRTDSIFTQMQSGNTTISLSDGNKDQFTDFLNGNRWNGISPNTQREITNAIQGGGGSISGGMDGRRFWVETEKGFGVSIISSNGLSESGATQDGNGNPVYDRATLENRGYSYNKINGKEYWAKEVSGGAMAGGSGKPLFEEY